ncbi:MAG: asparaginase [Thermaerobacter sp.]|nr:asparaginase [Thermaerobacter sp.]
MSERAVEIWRGERVESRAWADVAVVDSLGQLQFWLGDPHRETFWRSSAKPFQAMPVILSGAAAQFGFGPREIAMVSASHGGEPFHVELVEEILKRLPATAGDLICGAHAPSHRPSAEALAKAGDSPRVVHNNCSGKHAGMLATARALGADYAGYADPGHPVQRLIRDNVARMTAIAHPDDIYSGVDGCGVPTFYLPLSRMAYAYARLVDPRGLDPDVAGAALMVAEAMRMHPELVSGTGRLEVTLSEATGRRLVAKGGAEAVFCLGLPERGLGMAVKVDDGHSRVLPALIPALLDQMGVLSAAESRALADTVKLTLYNHAAKPVGRLKAVLTLQAGRIR